MLKRFSALLFIILLTACTSSAPLLMPTATGKHVPQRDSIQILVKPITTKGIGSEDEKRLGIDLSDYFTAFDVALVNQTKEDITFLLNDISLLIEAEEEYRPLDEQGSIQYYKDGDDPDRLVLIPKSIKRVNKEIGIIKTIRLQEGDIAPRSQRKGLILFKKVSQKHCRDVLLSFEKITVIRTGEVKRFSFPFSCDEKK